jgi:hypothetical protein
MLKIRISTVNLGVFQVFLGDVQYVTAVTDLFACLSAYGTPQLVFFTFRVT